MGVKRLLRMMAGDLRSPSERMAQREARSIAREAARMYQSAVLIDKIQRREKGDPDLPPMPLDFEEIEKRSKK